MMLQFTSNAHLFLPEDWLSSRLSALSEAQKMLETGNGPGGDFTGWISLPEHHDRTEFLQILQAADKIRTQSRALVVIGIGGSYLGARAVLELLHSPYYNLTGKDTPQIFFAGNSLSPDALNELLDLMRDIDFSVNVISKSGTTTETTVAFLLFKALLEQKYGKDGARQRIFATTDRACGVLKELANAEGYETFVIPNDVGGRYSVLTPVGLLPLAVAGIDIDQLLAGAAQARDLLRRPRAENPAWQYAATRHALYTAGKRVELLACYEPAFRYFGEWWKQLFGESEGKNGKGLFPASLEYSADLHSLGQYVQEGERILFETVLRFEHSRTHCRIPDNSDLSFLSGQDLHMVNEQARLGTLLAHTDGEVPNLLLTVEERTAACIGQLLYFFQYTCGLSGYLLGVNPFNQPGVEAYKQNMLALLGKPGSEARRASLNERLRGWV